MSIRPRPTMAVSVSVCFLFASVTGFFYPFSLCLLSFRSILALFVFCHWYVVTICFVYRLVGFSIFEELLTEAEPSLFFRHGKKREKRRVNGHAALR